MKDVSTVITIAGMNAEILYSLRTTRKEKQNTCINENTA